MHGACIRCAALLTPMKQAPPLKGVAGATPRARSDGAGRTQGRAWHDSRPTRCSCVQAALIRKPTREPLGPPRLRIKVAGKAVADGGRRARPLEAQRRLARVVGRRASRARGRPGVLECEHRLRGRQRREAVQAHDVGRFQVLAVVVRLRPAGPAQAGICAPALAARAAHTQRAEARARAAAAGAAWGAGARSSAVVWHGRQDARVCREPRCRRPRTPPPTQPRSSAGRGPRRSPPAARGTGGPAGRRAAPPGFCQPNARLGS
jgi:hypothetical protein